MLRAFALDVQQLEVEIDHGQPQPTSTSAMMPKEMESNIGSSLIESAHLRCNMTCHSPMGSRSGEPLLTGPIGVVNKTSHGCSFVPYNYVYQLKKHSESSQKYWVGDEISHRPKLGCTETTQNVAVQESQT